MTRYRRLTAYDRATIDPTSVIDSWPHYRTTIAQPTSTVTQRTSWTADCIMHYKSVRSVLLWRRPSRDQYSSSLYTSDPERYTLPSLAYVFTRSQQARVAEEEGEGQGQG